MCIRDRYEAVKDQIVVRALDFVRVMGKTEPVKVFELISEKDQEPEIYKKILPVFHEGLECYFKQDWDKAIEAFQTELVQIVEQQKKKDDEKYNYQKDIIGNFLISLPLISGIELSLIHI